MQLNQFSNEHGSSESRMRPMRFGLVGFDGWSLHGGMCYKNKNIGNQFRSPSKG